MSKGFADNRRTTQEADDATAVLSLELEKNRVRRRAVELAKRLLTDLDRKLNEPEKKKNPPT